MYVSTSADGAYLLMSYENVMEFWLVPSVFFDLNLSLAYIIDTWLIVYGTAGLTFPAKKNLLYHVAPPDGMWSDSILPCPLSSTKKNTTDQNTLPAELSYPLIPHAFHDLYIESPVIVEDKLWMVQLCIYIYIYTLSDISRLHPVELHVRRGKLLQQHSSILELLKTRGCPLKRNE